MTNSNREVKARSIMHNKKITTIVGNDNDKPDVKIVYPVRRIEDRDWHYSHVEMTNNIRKSKGVKILGICTFVAKPIEGNKNPMQWIQDIGITAVSWLLKARQEDVRFIVDWHPSKAEYTLVGVEVDSRHDCEYLPARIEIVKNPYTFSILARKYGSLDATGTSSAEGSVNTREGSEGKEDIKEAHEDIDNKQKSPEQILLDRIDIILDTFERYAKSQVKNVVALRWIEDVRGVIDEENRNDDRHEKSSESL